jgi:hypothetical protein
MLDLVNLANGAPLKRNKVSDQVNLAEEPHRPVMSSPGIPMILQRCVLPEILNANIKSLCSIYLERERQLRFSSEVFQ